MRQKLHLRITYNMKIQQIQLILKEQLERRLQQMAYIWGEKEDVGGGLGKRVK